MKFIRDDNHLLENSYIVLALEQSMYVTFTDVTKYLNKERSGRFAYFY